MSSEPEKRARQGSDMVMQVVAGGPEIAFFDVETTVPGRGEGYMLLEFGAILVCPRRLVEVACFATLIRPADLGAVNAASVRCNGITRDSVAIAPTFSEVAHIVFDFLDGRVWAGHNIIRFDCARIREAFAEIGRPPPEAKGLIDTLPLLTQRFGRRAGDMKMASLANYFNLGRQSHRSLDDVRMNLEVVKSCATVLFLEACLPNITAVENSPPHENTLTRSQVNGKGSPELQSAAGGMGTRGQVKGKGSPEVQSAAGGMVTRSQVNGKGSPELQSAAGGMVTRSQANGKGSPERQSNMPDSTLVPQVAVHRSSFENDDEMLDDAAQNSSVIEKESKAPAELIAHIEEMNLERSHGDEGCSGFSGFLEPDEVSLDGITLSLIPFNQFGQKTVIKHKDCPLQICCMNLKIHFGVSAKYVDYAGRPKLSIVVGIQENICKILDFCDKLAQKTSQESGSTSEWRSVVKRNGYWNLPTVRLHIPTVATMDPAVYSTDIYQKEPAGNIRKLVFTKLDAAELEPLFVPGSTLDTFFSLDTYDYQQLAGIRLVAKRLFIHPK